jgi:hypothetical protein
MLLGLGALRYLTLDAAHQAKYRVTGAGRTLHQAAVALCCVCAAMPLLQLSRHIAGTLMGTGGILEPFEIFGVQF